MIEETVTTARLVQEAITRIPFFLRIWALVNHLGVLNGLSWLLHLHGPLTRPSSLDRGLGIVVLVGVPDKAYQAALLREEEVVSLVDLGV